MDPTALVQLSTTPIEYVKMWLVHEQTDKENRTAEAIDLEKI